MSPIAGECIDAPAEACGDSRRMLQEAIISARKELEAAKLSARAELHAKHQQLLGIRKETEAPAVEAKLQAADLAGLPSPERICAEQNAMVNWESQEEPVFVDYHPIQLPALSEASLEKENEDELCRSGRALHLEERLRFGAGPHCEGRRSPKKRRPDLPERSGLVSIEAIQAEHEAQRESWSKALAAHEKELMQEREMRAKEKETYDEQLKQERDLRARETAALQEELQKERSLRAKEAATYREEWVVHTRQGVDQLEQEQRRHELESTARESQLAEERELRRREAASNAELQTLLDKSLKELASLRTAGRTKEAETAPVEQNVASSINSIGSAETTRFNSRAKGGSCSDAHQKSIAQSGNGLARRLFEGDAQNALSSLERTPKWPKPAPGAVAASSATGPDPELANPIQGSVLKRINALEAAKHFDLSNRAASQPPPVPLGAKPNFHQEAEETTPRGKVFSIRHQLERRAPLPCPLIKSITPSTSPRNPPSWAPEAGSQSARGVRWVKGNTTPTTSSLVKERVRLLENSGR